MFRLVKFLKQPVSHKQVVIEAVFWMGLVRLFIILFPFRWIAPYLGKHMKETPAEKGLTNQDLTNRISWAINAASPHLPWECKCLVQAVTGKIMLKYRGIQTTLYLGLAKDEANQLSAHAWLRCGDLILTGQNGMDKFKIISSFAEESY